MATAREPLDHNHLRALLPKHIDPTPEEFSKLIAHATNVAEILVEEVLRQDREGIWEEP